MRRIDNHADEDGVIDKGIIRDIVLEEKVVFPWLTVNQIYGQRRRRRMRWEEEERSKRKRKEMKQELKQELKMEEEIAGGGDDDDEEKKEEEEVEIEEPAPSIIENLLRIGRKKGSTNAAKAEAAERKARMIDEIAHTYHACKESDEHFFTLQEIISLKKKDFDMLDEHVPTQTIYTRRRRHLNGRPMTNVKRGQTSPLDAVEPTLCCILAYASRLGQYVSQRQCIDIVNELIKGKEIGRQVVEWKRRFNPSVIQRLQVDRNFSPKEEVGWGWLVGFCKRYPEITSKYITNVKHYRSTWSTHAMLSDMYNIVYSLFLDWGLAEKLPEPQWQDEEGNEVPEHDALGCKVEYKLLYPDRILTMDETGDKGNQADDKPSRSEKFLTESGTSPKVGSAVDDTSWTVQAYTTLGGKPVLYVIILKKGSVLNFNEHNGFDLSAEWLGDGEEACKKGKLPTVEQMKLNSGPGRRFPGPISCEFNGITIPSLVFASKGGGVNEDILVASLKHLDNLNVFPRQEGIPDPTLFVDGHGSRLQPKFVQYTNNLKDNWTTDKEANHRWNIALGLPHATHHWQVPDSEQLNQSFKALSREMKAVIRKFQERLGVVPSIKRYHVVQICNYALKESFGQEAKVKKAVAMRGWNPLNKNCLTYQEIQRTKVTDDMTFDRLKALTPAELNIIEHGKEVIDTFNWTGDVTRDVFQCCAQKLERFKAQDEAIRRQREKQKENGAAVFEVTGRMTSGKMYLNGVATINNVEVISHFKKKEKEDDQKAFEKECKKYAQEQKRFKSGQELLAKISAKKEENPNSQLNHSQLDTLLKWKFTAVDPSDRPKLSNFGNLKGAQGLEKKMELWAEWEGKSDPEPPEKPQDFELYEDGVGSEVMLPSAPLGPVRFPQQEIDEKKDEKEDEKEDAVEESQFTQPNESELAMGICDM